MPSAARRLAVVLALLLVLAAALGSWRRAEPSREAVKPLPSAWVVGRGKRIMVFAPHSDDEVLGAGGLLQRAVKAGASVRLALVTNGDGFALAAEDRFHSINLPPAKYIEFAYLRQQETLAALESLGLPRRAVTFLGFPDRGTAEEWENHWSRANPYTSRYTRLSHSPYRNSYVRGAPFSGAALADEIAQLIRDFQPEVIVLPHPNDIHPDHWATHNFVIYALDALQHPGSGEPALFRNPPLLLTYLVHRGAWPVPQGYFPRLALAPPPHLLHLDTRWWAFPLSPGETEAKRRAILEYRTQTAVMRRYLLSFARANDLYGILPATPEVGQGRIAVVLDPVGDSLPREAEGAGDLRAITLSADRLYLYFRLSLRRPPSPFVAYHLHLHALPAQPDGAPSLHDLRLRYWKGEWVAFAVRGRRLALAADCPVVLSGNDLVVRIPREAAGPRKSLFVAAESHLGRRLDRSAWRLVRLK